MIESNWKTWALMAVIAVGVTFELLKHLPGQDSVAWQAENLHLSDNQPYSVHTRHGSRSAMPRAVRPAGEAKILQSELTKYIAATKPMTTEFDKKKAAAAKAKKKKDDDEYEEVIDPVTGQKVRRKKKKDDKKDEKAVEAKPIPIQLDPLPTIPPPNDPSAVIAAAVAAAAVNNEPTGTIAPTANDAFNSLQQWEKRLLAYPDLAQTQLFITQYKSHLVSEEVFYQIANMMIADPRADMQQLGVLCAGDTPSANSFLILSAVDKSTDTAAVKTNADKFIAAYGTVANLSTLQAVLSGGDVHAATLAARELDTAVEQALKTGTTAPSSNPTAQGTGAMAVYQPFVSILRGLSTSHDSGLSAQAKQTLSDLQHLIAENEGSSTPIASTP